MIKRRIIAGVTAAAMSCMMTGLCQAEELSAAQIVEDIATVQAFTDEAIPEEDLISIVMAGVNAPSAINSQPWHFTVITNQDTIQQLADGGSAGAAATDAESAEGASEGAESADAESAEGASEGAESADGESADGESAAAPAAAATSGAKAGIGDAPVVIVISCKDGYDLDAGLATQNMSAEAQILGYGTKILTSPTMTLNGANQAEYKELLGIPDDMAVAAVLILGFTDTEEYDVVSGATTRNAVEDVVTFIK